MMPFASPYGAPLYWSFHERPEAWHIDPFHQYAKQLAFFGGGRFTHSTHYHDSSLYGNHGTLTNMDPATDYVRELGRWALDFDGNNDVIYSPNKTSLQLLGGGSVFAWINMRTTGEGAAGRVVECGTASTVGVDGWLLNFYGESWRVNFRVNADDQTYGTTNGIVANQWSHIGATIRSTFSRRVWLNGVDDTQGVGGSTATLVSANPLAIGNRSSATDRTADGMIADVMIWDRVLSSSEIEPLADPSNVMLSLGGSDPGLIVPDDLVYPVYLPSSVVAGAKPALWLGVCV